jgi:2-desacetyl-2-hydroxyethyl bacteriochlorophyllide A dehydrogenase
MKALVCVQPGKFEYTTAKEPQLERNQAIIKIKRIGICGTDLHAFEGTQPYFHYPRILGHELSGELVAFDSASGFELGEPVSFLPYFSCGKCIACRSYKPNCCVNLQVCGVHVDGGMAEYLSVPSSYLLHGPGLSFDDLALIEPLAIGLHGVRRAGIQAGEFVLIVGAGPIGMAAMEFAGMVGATVIALDVNDRRLSFCKNNLKVTHTLSASVDNVSEQLREITHGDMPSVIIDATGNLQAINKAFHYMAHAGRYVLIGLQKGNVSFSHPEFHKREGTLMSSRNSTRQEFEQVIEYTRNREIKPDILITHRVHFDDVAREFASWLKPENAIIKAMVEIE